MIMQCLKHINSKSSTVHQLPDRRSTKVYEALSVEDVWHNWIVLAKGQGRRGAHREKDNNNLCNDSTD
jgi:hypothetical protein